MANSCSVIAGRQLTDALHPDSHQGAGCRQHIRGKNGQATGPGRDFFPTNTASLLHQNINRQ